MCFTGTKIRSYLMINLSKYTKHGKFKLHSGQYSDIFYDVKEMICNDELSEILNYVETNLDLHMFNTIVGIESAGAIIASQVYMMMMHDIRLAIVTKDNKLIGKVVEPYLLIDDTSTTENSIRKAIEIIGKEPAKIYVVVDRREQNKSSLKIDSMFRV